MNPLIYICQPATGSSSAHGGRHTPSFWLGEHAPAEANELVQLAAARRCAWARRPPAAADCGRAGGLRFGAACCADCGRGEDGGGRWRGDGGCDDETGVDLPLTTPAAWSR